MGDLVLTNLDGGGGGGRGPPPEMFLQIRTWKSCFVGSLYKSFYKRFSNITPSKLFILKK